MRQQFRDLDTWRGKLTATWIILAPPAAMVAVVAVGGTSNTFVVDAHALGQPRHDSVFDSLVDDVPTEPGVDGSIGTEKRSSIEVPWTGTVDNKQQPVIGPIGSASGIPATVLAAYQKAANDLAAAMPGCHITWPLLAGIGKVESAHASGGRVDAAGNTRGQILGPVLDGGPGMAAISDTDQGRFDGNTSWDRAVGPMQFIPGTWQTFGADGNGDGLKNPHNIFDAARAAGDYLCSGGANLSDPQGLVQAVLRYNHSMEYVSTVLRWMQAYSKSTITTPDGDGVIDPPVGDTGNVQKDDDPTQVPTDDSTPKPSATTSAQSTTPATTRPAQSTSPTTTPSAVPTTNLPVTTQPSKTSPPWSPKPPTKPASPPLTSTTPPPSNSPGTPAPTSTPTQTPTQTPSETPSAKPSETPSETPSSSPTSPSTSPTQSQDTQAPCEPSASTTPSSGPTPGPTPNEASCTPTEGNSGTADTQSTSETTGDGS